MRIPRYCSPSSETLAVSLRKKVIQMCIRDRTASNLMISLLRKIIPDGVRMPAYIVVVASFVTIVEFLMEGFIPALYSALGIYIPLIVVNCIILGRAEAYAGKHGPIPSLFDGKMCIRDRYK